MFIDEVDIMATPIKAKGVGELGIGGTTPPANALYNAIGVPVRDFPLTIDQYIERLPATA